MLYWVVHVVLNNLDSKKRYEILKFFRDNFKINLENYEENEIDLVVSLINSEINRKLDNEIKKNRILSYELEKQKKILLELNNSFDN